MIKSFPPDRRTWIRKYSSNFNRKPFTSRFIPAFSGNTVLWSHSAVSADFDDRVVWFQNLFQKYQDWNDDQRSRDFWGAGIEYIFVDDSPRQSIREERWKWDTILKNADEVFKNGSVVIYKHRAG